MPAIVLDRVSRVYAKTVRAVSELTLEVPDGSFTTLLGPSGCGKTTTLRMIAGLEMPTSGTIHIGDQVAFSLDLGRSMPPSKRGLGLVFQSYALWPHLTVAQNITFGLEVQRVGKAEAKRRLEEVAGALQIDGLLGRYTSELSGGQQQRVAIARVLVMRPSVLLLDEPLSNLDATLRMDMRAELKRLHLETGATVLYVTHDQLEALTMSTHIALMNKGELQQFAPPLELYAHPANRFAADFLGNPRINLLEGRLEGDHVAIGQLRVPVPAGLGGGRRRARHARPARRGGAPAPRTGPGPRPRAGGVGVAHGRRLVLPRGDGRPGAHRAPERHAAAAPGRGRPRRGGPRAAQALRRRRSNPHRGDRAGWRDARPGTPTARHRPLGRRQDRGDEGARGPRLLLHRQPAAGVPAAADAASGRSRSTTATGSRWRWTSAAARCSTTCSSRSTACRPTTSGTRSCSSTARTTCWCGATPRRGGAIRCRRATASTSTSPPSAACSPACATAPTWCSTPPA